MGDVAGGAVLDAGGPMHHLEGRETHPLVSSAEWNRMESNLTHKEPSERLSNLGVRLNPRHGGFINFRF